MRRVLTLILSFFIISSSHADFNQFGAGNADTGSDGSGNPSGAMNVFEVLGSELVTHGIVLGG